MPFIQVYNFLYNIDTKNCIKKIIINLFEIFRLNGQLEFEHQATPNRARWLEELNSSDVRRVIDLEVILGEQVSHIELSFEFSRDKSPDVRNGLGNRDTDTWRGRIKILLIGINECNGISGDPTIHRGDVRSGSSEFGTCRLAVRTWKF